MRPITRLACLALAGLCALAPGARAAVVSSGPSGFVVHQEISIARPAQAAWQRLLRVQDWWSSEHTWSGKASNLSLELRPGGCWCERLAGGGFVRHMEVIYANPPRMLRLAGGLGPLQGMGASGTLSVTLKPDTAGGTQLSVEYAVTGYFATGHAELANAVDHVLAEQFARYAAPAGT
jgi:hypothetical protein